MELTNNWTTVWED